MYRYTNSNKNLFETGLNIMNLLFSQTIGLLYSFTISDDEIRFKNAFAKILKTNVENLD